MVSRLFTRRSAVTFDLGAAGIRACQFAQRGAVPQVCDVLALERGYAADADTPVLPPVDAGQLARLMGQGRFAGRDVALVVSPPEVQFYPMRLAEAVLSQPPARVIQALAWEVAHQSRTGPEELEVRYWQLPTPRGHEPNVMAVALARRLAEEWCTAAARQGLTLRRIDVSPCAVVKVACQFWQPAPTDLWGVLDLGLRHATLTVVLGTVPVYVRSMAVSAHQWTRQVAAAFEVPYAVAEQLKREHGVAATARGVRGSGGGHSLLHARDLGSALSSILSEPLRTLANDVARCFAYVMHAYPDGAVKRLYLAGGGSELRGLPALLQKELDIPVQRLARDADTPAANPLSPMPLAPRGAAALGGALLDLEAA
jgi:type IV pilus assembly protein PilM